MSYAMVQNNDSWIESVGFHWDGRAEILDPEFLGQEYFLEHPERKPMVVFGKPVPDWLVDRIPKVVTVSRLSRSGPVKRLPDLVEFMVSGRLREVIERLEPGVHEFFPVSLVFEKTGQPAYDDQSWYIFNICTLLRFFEVADIIPEKVTIKEEFQVFERTKIKWRKTDVSFKGWHPDECFIYRKNTIAGRHIWRLGRYKHPVEIDGDYSYQETYSISDGIYVSDEFYEEWQRLGLSAARFYKMQEH